MKIHIADHPLITHKLTVLRDEKTDSPTFRRLTEEIVTLLAYEAMREVKTQAVTVKTPVAMAQGAHLTKPKIVVVPILRAGLRMLEGFSRLIATAEIGFLGMVRDEKTLKATTYANRLPEDLKGRQCYILDPMLATGGTLVAAIEFLAAKGATDITAICIFLGESSEPKVKAFKSVTESGRPRPSRRVSAAAGGHGSPRGSRP